MPNYLDRIAAMHALERNWDSYGADPADPETLRIAADFLQTFIPAANLPDPQVVATRVGGVCAFWEVGGHELEMEFEPQGGPTVVTYVFEDMGSGEVLRGEFRIGAAPTVRPVWLNVLARELRDRGPQVAV